MTFQQFVTKMLNDQAFRQAVAKNPEAALKAERVIASPELVAALKKVDYGQLGKVAAAFGVGISPDTAS